MTFGNASPASVAIGTQRIPCGARVRAATLAVPVLLQHGTADRMVSIDGSRQFAQGPGAPRVRLIEYDALHALFADEGYEQRLADLTTWMESLE